MIMVGGGKKRLESAERAKKHAEHLRVKKQKNKERPSSKRLSRERSEANRVMQCKLFHSISTLR